MTTKSLAKACLQSLTKAGYTPHAEEEGTIVFTDKAGWSYCLVVDEEPSEGGCIGIGHPYFHAIENPDDLARVLRLVDRLNYDTPGVKFIIGGTQEQQYVSAIAELMLGYSRRSAKRAVLYCLRKVQVAVSVFLHALFVAAERPEGDQQSLE